MQAIHRMDPTPALFPPLNQALGSETDRIVRIGRWMMVLGGIRVLCALADWGGMGHLIAVGAPTAGVESESIGGLLEQDRGLAAILGAAWLAAIGVLARRSRRPELLTVAASTFAFVAVLGLASLTLSASLRSEKVLPFGSFTVGRPELTAPTFRGVALALLGVVQLLTELCVSIRAFRLLPKLNRHHDPVDAARPTWFDAATPRSRSSIMQACWIASALAVFLIVRIPEVSSIQHLVEASPILRDLLLINDQTNLAVANPPRPPSAQRMEDEQKIQRLANTAATAWDDARYQEASAAYEQIVTIYLDSKDPLDAAGRHNLALFANNYAWLLVTRPDRQPGDPQKAVENAQLAIDTDPSEGRFWNTLAAAQYRAENWQATKEALLRATELRGDGDGSDWILFALLYSRTGRKEHALQWYHKAARWRESFRPWDQDLYTFETEAADRLGLPSPPVPPPRRAFQSWYSHDETLSRLNGFFLEHHMDYSPHSLRHPRRSMR